MRTLVLLAGALVLAGTACAQQPISLQSCLVTAVSDGDTLRCAGLGRVRLIGVDAPERGQGAEADSARAALRRWAPRGDTVALELDVRPRDQYGRHLAWVWRGDTLVNERMVAEGRAVLYTVPPNVRHVDRIRRAEREARRERRGLWREGALDCRPAEWRRDRCGG
jgi:micrococcal nuclease